MQNFEFNVKELDIILKLNVCCMYFVLVLPNCIVYQMSSSTKDVRRSENSQSKP